MGLYNNIALFFSFENLLKESMEVICYAEVVSLKEEKNYLDKYTLKIINCSKNLEVKNKKFITYIEKEKNYKPGDIIYLKGIAERADEERNLYGFNNRNYLKQNKIYGIINVEDTKYIKTRKDLYYFLGKIQISLKEKVLNLYNESYENVVNKILFGTKDTIAEDVNNNFRDAGISHVLAISGLHISYVVMIINYILEKLIHNIKTRNLFICIILILFLFITGASPSCSRACIMNVLYLIAQNVYRKSNIYISIGFAFCMLLFFNMYVVYNIGMWLSFLGTLGIVLFHPFFSKIFIGKKNSFIYKIIDIILVSFSAQILIWPLTLYYFNTISLTFFISNIFISILIGPIVILGYISALFSYFILPLAKIVVFVEEILLKILFLISDICSKIPFSKIYIKGTNTWILIVYYSLICFIIYYYLKNKLKVFRSIIFIRKLSNFKNINKKKKYLYIIKNKFKQKILSFKRVLKIKNINRKYFIIVIIIITLGAYCSKVVLNSNFKMFFVDVGQGDCCIIQVEGKNIIIDGGEGNSDSYDYGKNVVFQHLLKLGIDKLDYMIFSHMDSDHARTD